MLMPAIPSSVAVAFSPGCRGQAATASRHTQRSLRGRRLAAEAAGRLMDDAGAQALAVEKDPNGRPWLRADGKPTDIDVSISHTGDCVVAAAVRGQRIGIDVEPLAATPQPRTWRFFLTPEEIDACMADPRRALWTWMIKEAAYKALDAREPLDFKTIVVRGWDSGRPTVWIKSLASSSAPEVYLQEWCGYGIVTVLVRP